MLMKRIIYFLITIWGVVTITFFMMALAPGDPAMVALGDRATSETIAEFRTKMGLDKPLLVQYFIYIKNIMLLDFGRSIRSEASVSQEILDRFPATIELAMVAISIAVVMGILIGVFSAVYRNTIVDYLSMSVALLGVSMPIFWLGLIFILTFSINLDLLPTGGRMFTHYFMEPITGFYILDGFLYIFKEGTAKYFIGAITHIILPAITVSTIPLSIIARVTRASMLEVLSSDYITTAVAYGIKKKKILFYYALKNALLPVVTVIGLQFGVLMAGAILTETIFSWPGIGRWIYQGIISRDFLVVQGGVIVVATVFVLVNLIVDLLYLKINPKVKI